MKHIIETLKIKNVTFTMHDMVKVAEFKGKKTEKAVANGRYKVELTTGGKIHRFETEAKALDWAKAFAGSNDIQVVNCWQHDELIRVWGNRNS